MYIIINASSIIDILWYFDFDFNIYITKNNRKMLLIIIPNVIGKVVYLVIRAVIKSINGIIMKNTFILVVDFILYVSFLLLLLYKK